MKLIKSIVLILMIMFISPTFAISEVIHATVPCYGIGAKSGTSDTASIRVVLIKNASGAFATGLRKSNFSLVQTDDGNGNVSPITFAVKEISPGAYNISVTPKGWTWGLYQCHYFLMKITGTTESDNGAFTFNICVNSE